MLFFYLFGRLGFFVCLFFCPHSVKFRGYSGSTLQNHSWPCSVDIEMPEDETGSPATRQVPFLLCYLHCIQSDLITLTEYQCPFAITLEYIEYVQFHISLAIKSFIPNFKSLSLFSCLQVKLKIWRNCLSPSFLFSLHLPFPLSSLHIPPTFLISSPN